MKLKLLLIIIIFLQCNLSLFSYNSDIEVAGFTKPGIVKADTGLFSDAKYVMGNPEIGVLLRNNGMISMYGVKTEFQIFIEDSTGTFSQLVYSYATKVDIPYGDSVELILPLMDNANSFIPKTFEELADSFPQETIPKHFRTMIKNVTPRYLITVSVGKDQNMDNNSKSETFRFYLQHSLILISAENSFADIENETDRDLIAGKLNSDSLCLNFQKLGYTSGDTINMYDLFDRKGWEPSAVDYTQYRFLFWSDADDKPLTELEKENITKFNVSAKPVNKKGMVICSQEMFRMNWDTDSTWVKNTIFGRKYPAYPTDPNGGKVFATEDNPDRYLIGSAIRKGQPISIKRTLGFPADTGSVPGLMTLFPEVEGLVRESFVFNPSGVICPPPVITTAGTATITIKLQTVYLAVDWRHIGDNENILIEFMDFLNRYSDTFYEHHLYVDPDNAKKYPGENVVYSFNAKYTDMKTPDSLLIEIIDQINDRTTSFSVLNPVEGQYKVSIPPDTKPGNYTIHYFASSSGNYHFDTHINHIVVLSDSGYISGKENVCLNDISVYTASGPDRRYSWVVESGGEITGSHTDSVVSVKWTNEGELELVLKQTIIPTGITKEYRYGVTVNSLPPRPVITCIDDTLFSSSETGNTWLLDGNEISGENEHYLFPQKSGYYTLYVTGSNGCKSPVSEPVNFETFVKEGSDISVLRVYPNPAENRFVVEINSQDQTPGSLKITDLLGNGVFEKEVDCNKVTGRFSIGIENLSPGLYFVIYSNGNNRVVTQLIHF